ncbi:sulfatase-like hydrolase/transferase [Candidatus Omnitrophota bacterium]
MALVVCIVSLFFYSPFDPSVLGIRIIDVPMYSMAPLLYKVSYISSTIVVLFLFSLVFILIALFLNSLLKQKGALLFWFSVLAISSYKFIKILLNASSPPLFLYILFGSIILIITFLMFCWIWAKSKFNKSILTISLSFIAIIIVVVLFNFLATRSFFSIFTLLGLLCFHFICGFFAKLDDAARLKIKNRFQLFSKIVIALIIIQTLVVAVVFSWEGIGLAAAYRSEMSEMVTSKTNKDANVILVMVDTLRADHLGCYGYQRKTSPFIDAFAREGTVFGNCYAQASWTSPSCASLLTSLYPSIHGVISSDYILPDQVTTMAEVFQDQGYVTYCYLANPSLRRIYNFQQGYDYFDDYLMRDTLFYAVLRNLPIFKHIIKNLAGTSFSWQNRDNAQLANERIFPWLDKHKDENFFMYLHYMDPHSTYAPPSPYNRMFSHIQGDVLSRRIALYDGEIRFFDDKFKELVDKLKSLDIYDKTLIVLVSDHGEGFLEHGQWEHGFTLYDEEVKVPFIIKYDGYVARGRSVSQPVRLIDVMPTVLDLLNIEYNIPVDGRSLAPMLGAQSLTMEPQDVYMEVVSGKDEYVLKGLVRGGTWKYILTEASQLRDIQKLGNEELLNLKNDPRELRNLSRQNPEILTGIKKYFNFYRKHCSDNAISPPEVEKNFEIVEQLRALGYLQ